MEHAQDAAVRARLGRAPRRGALEHPLQLPLGPLDTRRRVPVAGALRLLDRRYELRGRVLQHAGAGHARGHPRRRVEVARAHELHGRDPAHQGPGDPGRRARGLVGSVAAGHEPRAGARHAAAGPAAGARRADGLVQDLGAVRQPGRPARQGRPGEPRRRPGQRRRDEDQRLRPDPAAALPDGRELRRLGRPRDDGRLRPRAQGPPRGLLPPAGRGDLPAGLQAGGLRARARRHGLGHREPAALRLGRGARQGRAVRAHLRRHALRAHRLGHACSRSRR